MLGKNQFTKRMFRRMPMTSVLLLVVLTILAINPLMINDRLLDNRVYAKDKENSEITPYSLDPYSPIITLSLGTKELKRSVDPTAEGKFIAQSTSLSIDVERSDGYMLYLSGTPSLVGSDLTNGTTIDSIESNTTVTNFPVNTWGYNISEGKTVNPETLSYAPVHEDRDLIDSMTRNPGEAAIDIQKDFVLSLGAKFDTTVPADTYSGSVTVSLIATPFTVAVGFDRITYMQEMTPEICLEEKVHYTKQLIDQRDGKSYWVAKLADGNCWMTQNFALDITGAGLNMSDGSNVDWNAESEYPPKVTQDTVSLVEGVTNVTSTLSWSMNQYLIIDPVSATGCGMGKVSLAECPSRFVEVGDRRPSADPDFYEKNGATYSETEYDAHYLAGNLYQWNAATSGTGGLITTTEASGSICPRGWGLPTSNNTDSGSFGGLLDAYSITNEVTEIVTNPLYFVRGGVVYLNDNKLSHAGNLGLYWSSTADSAGLGAYNLQISGNNGINPSYGRETRSNGCSVRCLFHF